MLLNELNNISERNVQLEKENITLTDDLGVLSDSVLTFKSENEEFKIQ